MPSFASRRTAYLAFVLAASVVPAQAHVGMGPASSLSAGFGHPLAGLDHVAVMIAVGLWAAQKGGRAIWAWPAAFVGLMLAGSVLGMAHVPLAFVGPAILASVVALGLLVALAIELPVAAGATVVGLFALFHGHAHGTETGAGGAGLEYMAGFALATALLHALGIAAGLRLGARFAALVRAAGAACATLGAGLALGMI
jgi:urease accessory protein